MNNWNPIYFNNNSLNSSSNYIKELSEGKYSCIIIKNLINKDICEELVKHLVNKKILNKNLDFNNFNNFDFRKNSTLSDIGLTLDNQTWIKSDMNIYWKQTQKVNIFMEDLFNAASVNPFNIFIDTIKNICNKKYEIELMKYNDYCTYKGIIRVHNINNNTSFPYHTDGFNYGIFSNGGISDCIKSQIPVSDSKYKTNSVCAALFIMKQSKNLKNIDLYNCLVNDLEEYKDKLNGRSHRVGTKYANHKLLEKILSKKSKYTPLLETGDMYIFSASRIHKLNNILGNKRIVIATFFCIDDVDKKITLYQ